MLNVSSDPELKPPAPKPSQPTVAVPASPKRLSWGPFAAITVTLMDYILSNVVSAILVGLLFVSVVLPILGFTPDQFSHWLDGSVQQFIFILVAEVAALGFLWWFMRRRKIGLADIGFSRRPHWSDLGWALFGFFCYFGLFIIVAIISQQLGVNTEQKQDIGVDTYGQSPFGLGLMFLALIVLPPVTEEIIFRGFLFSGLRRAWSAVGTVLFVSVLFGLLHLFGGFSGEGLLWIAGIDTFILSLVLCYARLKTDTLWTPIYIHAMKNSVAFISLFILHLA